MTQQEKRLIDQWIGNRFGVPNVFNSQLLYDFLEFVKGTLGYKKS